MNRNIIKNLFPKEMENIDRGFCPICDKKIENFKDILSEKEFGISGMCQECQDKTFE